MLSYSFRQKAGNSSFDRHLPRSTQALSDALAKRRKKSNLTQAQLAKMLKSSQSRVAKMEKGDPTVSVDLLVKSLLAMGANKESIAKAIA